MSQASPRLLCLGNLTVDDVYLPDGTLVPDCTGGDALYAALGARLWEPEVQVVALVGKDLPKRTLNTIRSAGLGLDGLTQREVPTIHNRIFYDAGGGRRWEVLVPDNVFDILSPRPPDIPMHYREAEAFLILAMALEAQEELVPWLREHTNAVIALDTQEDYVEGNEERLRRLISQVDVFLPSAFEAGKLAGHTDWSAAARDFAVSGPQVVAIKLGAHGSLVYDRETHAFLEQPAIALDVVDTTGAGDAYCGGFMASYLHDRSDLRQAARAGAISASFAIASFGMDALLAAKPADAQAKLGQA